METRTITVVKRNETGIYDGTQWFNLSRWARSIDEFSVGDTVSITLDKQGFIRELRKVNGGNAAPPRPSTNGNGHTKPHDAVQIREKALACAVGLCKESFKDFDDARQVVTIAAMFEDYLRNGADL